MDHIEHDRSNRAPQSSRAQRRTDELRVGVDTGGTFTDFVVAVAGKIVAFKLPSTPLDPARAILEGLRRIREGFGVPENVVHGSTVATNTLLERKGARTALVTTAGFEDVIEIGRQARPQLYNLMVERPAPLVPRGLRFGIAERMGPDGRPILSIEAAGLAKLQRALRRAKPQSAAVCLLFSFANPDHERAVARALEPLGIPVSLSCEILPEYREYERTSTVVVNAYLAPRMSAYLESMEREITALGRARWAKRIRLQVMQSSGGTIRASVAAREPVRTILSGPAGGVVGALRVSKLAKLDRIIAFDMGGTSTDVCLCDGVAQTTNEAVIAGLPVAVPVIDIHTIGAGGGSIAAVDAGGALRVGPESAGADPGPACYGRGERATVTDANLVLGRLSQAGLLGGAMPLDRARAEQAVARVAADLARVSQRKVSVIEAALGIVTVVNDNMENALRLVSVERGHDPRGFTLVNYGGAGGVHVAALARALRIPRVLIPQNPGTLSALGVLQADVVKDFSRTVMWHSSGLNPRNVQRVFRELESLAVRELRNEGFHRSRMQFDRRLAVRYVGQSFELEVSASNGYQSAFHASHLKRYGYADVARPTEIVSLRLRASGLTEKPEERGKLAGRKRRAKPSSITAVHFAARPTPTPVYERETLVPGSSLAGPALITEYSSTTLAPPNSRVSIDAFGNLVIVA